MTYCLGWLLFGNIADNAFDPKTYIVSCCVFVGIYYIVIGLYIDLTISSIENVDRAIVVAKEPIMLIYAGIKAISQVQLFNWFPPRVRGSIIAIFLSAQSFGFLSGFFFGGLWNYFPNVPYTLASFLPEFATRHFIMGGLLLTCAVVDNFTFYNYPMQRSIITAKTERSTTENERLLEIS